jgi:exodeoxyribonuclease-5
MGDINQLPPVFGISSYMLRPDFCLTEIMRQAEGSPIIQLCQMILHDQHIDYGNYGNCRVLKGMNFSDKWVTDYDMILCNRNSTRDMINEFIRRDIYHRPKSHPVIGDKIMCKQNNWDMCVEGAYLTNGTVGTITDIFEETETANKLDIDFTTDFSDTCTFQDVTMDLKYLRGNYIDRKEYGISSYTKFEYANAITVHSSQGSQYDRILYIDDGFGGSRDVLKKLKYTAVSRAVNKIDIVNGYNLFKN